ncbi:MAG: AI-2E family transporter [Opitutaceae bacterium]|nr:AI-2E family transporter [Opitutaceae bacterium]
MADEEVSRFLSPNQRRVAGAAITFAGVIIIVALVVVSFVALGRMAAYFSGVLWPLAVAGVLALIMRPIVELAERQLALRRITAVVLLYGAFMVGMTGLLVLLVPPLIDQVLEFIAYAPTLWHNANTYLAKAYPEWVALVQRQMENPTIRQIVTSLTGEFNVLVAQALPSLKAASVGMLGVFAFAAQLAIVPIYLFFFLMSHTAPTRHLPEHLGFLRKSMRDDVVFLVDEFLSIVVSFFRGQLLIGLIMGTMLAIGFSFIGLKFGLFIGLALGILNIIPYLGTIIGLVVTLPLAFFQAEGGWRLVAMVLLVKIVVQAVEGWYLTPKIMGDRTGLHPVTIIVAIFFWGTAFDGVLGMLFAIPLTAFFVTLWRLLRRKYFADESATTVETLS